MNPVPAAATPDVRFLRTSITAMAVILVAGFVVQLAMGRSSFNSPLVVHAHAVVFMGWIGIVLTQVWLANTGAFQLHRLLGRAAVVWAFGMLVLGPLVTVAAVRSGRVPFFFQPQHFMLADTATVIGFFGLFLAAVAMRRRTDWHSRLQIGAFVLLVGPGVGRILPMPFLTPYAFEIAAATPLIMPAIGAIRDWRVHGRPHAAWVWSGVVLVAVLLAARLLAFSPAGDALYEMATAGSPFAGTDGRAFPPPPPGAP